MNMLKVVPDLNKIARPNWIEINLDALCENVAFIMSRVGNTFGEQRNFTNFITIQFLT